MKFDLFEDTGGIVSRLDDVGMNALERERARALARRAELLVSFVFAVSRGSAIVASRLMRLLAGRRSATAPQLGDRGA